MTKRLTLWHNPRCSTSRRGLELLRQAGVEVELRRYLDDPPSEQEIRQVLARAGIDAARLVRRKEKLFRELNLEGADEDRLIAAMAAHPRLIERPVGLREDRARLGRPPEALLDLLAPEGQE